MYHLRKSSALQAGEMSAGLMDGRVSRHRHAGEERKATARRHELTLRRSPPFHGIPER